MSEKLGEVADKYDVLLHRDVIIQRANPSRHGGQFESHSESQQNPRGRLDGIVESMGTVILDYIFRRNLAIRTVRQSVPFCRVAAGPLWPLLLGAIHACELFRASCQYFCWIASEKGLN